MCFHFNINRNDRIKSSVKLLQNKALPLKNRICSYVCKTFMWLPFEAAFVQRNKWWAARPQLPGQALATPVVTQEEQMHEKRCASLQVHLDSWGLFWNKSCETILHPQAAQGELQMSDSQWDLLLQQVKGLRHFCIHKQQSSLLRLYYFLVQQEVQQTYKNIFHKHLLQEKMLVQPQLSWSILPQFNSNFMFSLDNQQTA